MSKLRRRSGTPNDGDGTGANNDIQVPQANNNVVVVNQSAWTRVLQSCYEFCRRHFIWIIALILISAGGIAVIFVLMYHYDVLGQKKETATNNGGQDAHSRTELPCLMQYVDVHGAVIDDHDDKVKIADGHVEVVAPPYISRRVELCNPVTADEEVTILGLSRSSDMSSFKLEYNGDAGEAKETDTEDPAGLHGSVTWTKEGENKMKAIVKPPLFSLYSGERYVVSPKEGVIRRYDEKAASKGTWKIKQHGDKTIQKLAFKTMYGKVKVSKKKI